jgi:formate/nitrite transporter FocA (FNT family)
MDRFGREIDPTKRNPFVPIAEDDDAVAAPELTEKQREEAEERTSVSIDVVHEAVRKDGDEELNRSVSALSWSGLAAGLSMGFSFVAEALLYAYLPHSTWRTLLVRLGYPVGFLIVILGRQQLFTENTILAIIPLLARRNLSTFWLVMRLWLVVLLSNMVGAHIFAWVVANTPMFKPEVQNAMLELAKGAIQVSFGAAIIRGIFAGWLIALIVWMLAAMDTGRVAIIFILTYLVGLGDFTHIIAGAVEVLFLPMSGYASWGFVASGYLLPTLIGNIIGGTALTAAINHAQVVAGRKKKPPQTRRIVTS